MDSLALVVTANAVSLPTTNAAPRSLSRATCGAAQQRGPHKAQRECSRGRRSLSRSTRAGRFLFRELVVQRAFAGFGGALGQDLATFRSCLPLGRRAGCLGIPPSLMQLKMKREWGLEPAATLL